MEHPVFQFIRQLFPAETEPEVEPLLAAELAASGLLDAVRPGQKVVLTAGSRGIKAKPRVLAGLVKAIKERGADPLIVPAMGSHGGGTAPGQVEVLRHLGITEETVGAPIYGGWDLVELGTALDLVPVYADRVVAEADHVILVNRVKEHTEYEGETESGLVKISAIGLGRQLGAEWAHRLAVNVSYHKALQAVCRAQFQKLKILGGVAILEDQRNHLRQLKAFKGPEAILAGEPALMAESRTTKPKLPFAKLDFLLVDEIGKEISGTGCDTKVVGRIMNIYEAECQSPYITRVIFRDLSADTGGNAIGVGLADFVTRRLATKIDPVSTALNAITGGTPEKGRLPLVMESDRAALDATLRTIGVWQPATVRGAWIANSKDLECLAVTPALAEEAAGRADLAVFGAAFAPPYDQAGNLPKLMSLCPAGGH